MWREIVGGSGRTCCSRTCGLVDGMSSETVPFSLLTDSSQPKIKYVPGILQQSATTFVGDIIRHLELQITNKNETKDVARQDVGEQIHKR